MTLNTNRLDFTIVETAERLGKRKSKRELLPWLWYRYITIFHLVTQTIDKEYSCSNRHHLSKVKTCDRWPALASIFVSRWDRLLQARYGPWNEWGLRLLSCLNHNPIHRRGCIATDCNITPRIVGGSCKWMQYCLSYTDPKTLQLSWFGRTGQGCKPQRYGSYHHNYCGRGKLCIVPSHLERRRILCLCIRVEDCQHNTASGANVQWILSKIPGCRPAASLHANSVLHYRIGPATDSGCDCAWFSSFRTSSISLGACE